MWREKSYFRAERKKFCPNEGFFEALTFPRSADEESLKTMERILLEERMNRLCPIATGTLNSPTKTTLHQLLQPHESLHI